MAKKAIDPVFGAPPSEDELKGLDEDIYGAPPSEDEMKLVSALEGKEEKSFGGKAKDVASGILSGVGWAADLPTAPIRGLIGKAAGSEKQGLLPHSAPSMQDLIETVAPSTKASFKLDADKSLPRELQLDEGVKKFAGIPEEIKPSEAMAPYGDLGLGAGVGKALGGMASAFSKFGSGKAKALAESAAVNATGATGKQSAKFADNAGRELLDRKLVRFGDDAEKIAERTQGAMDVANSDIDTALRSLDEKGVTASADKVVETLQARIAEMKSDPSKAGTVRKLEGIINDIVETGNSNVPISKAEQTKRGFRKAAGNWMDPEAGQAGKEAYLSYMDEAERAATDASPELAEKFMQGKKTHGLLAPIQEAAEKRAATTSQSPYGGLLDTATVIGGAASGLGPAAIAAPIARRTIMPRLASSIAVSSDKVADALLKVPALAKLAETRPAAFSTILKGVMRSQDGAEEEEVLDPGLLRKLGDQKEKLNRTSEQK